MEENHNCLYCPYATTDMKKLKRHEEQLHGCFRDKVTRKNSWREPSTWNGKGKEKKVVDEVEEEDIKHPTHLGKLDIVRFEADGRKIDMGEKLSIYYIWDKTNEEYKMYTTETTIGDVVEIVFDNELNVFVPKRSTDDISGIL